MAGAFWVGLIVWLWHRTGLNRNPRRPPATLRIHPGDLGELGRAEVE